MKRELVEELLIVVGLPQQSRKLSIKLGSGKLRPQPPVHLDALTEHVSATTILSGKPVSRC